MQSMVTNMLVSLGYGLMEIIDGIIRILSLGLISTSLPMWFLTWVELRDPKYRTNDQ
jgi:hypothetical protein